MASDKQFWNESSTFVHNVNFLTTQLVHIGRSDALEDG